ncbi:MAG TPA: polymer-forming cytoskeletal protein [Xanthomonadales bacterium]|nr:polymer-forming cytoskeletal protein [Xanthomonadales bacterium]
MFGSDRKNAGRPTMAVDTLIGAQTVIRGDVTFSGGLHIDGQVHGAIIAEAGSDAVVTVSDKGRIEGEIRAPHVVINGTLQGDVIATERIELATQARVTGNIHYKLLEMHAGAQVNGQIMREEEPRRQPAKPVLDELPAPKVKAVS